MRRFLGLRSSAPEVGTSAQLDLCSAWLHACARGHDAVLQNRQLPDRGLDNSLFEIARVGFKEERRLLGLPSYASACCESKLKVCDMSG